MATLVGAAVLLVAGWSAAAGATCPDGWVKKNSYCYYFSTCAENQGFAVAKCRNMSAELASIHDAEENTFVTNTTKTVGHNHWLGMQRKSENSTDKTIEWKRKDWHWYDETNLDFVNWDVLQPNEDAVLCAIVKNVTGFWDDRSCNNLYRFICMRVLTQLPTSTKESTPNTTSTVSTTPITKQSSTSRSTTQLNNIVTSTSTYSGLAATSTTHKENQMGKRENGSGLGLYIGVGAAFIVIIIVALVITIIMCIRRKSKSNNPGTTAKSSVQADGDFVFVQNNIASSHQSGAANHLQGRQGNTQHHQYDNVNISDLRTFKQGAHNLDGKSSGVTPPPAAMLDVTQQRTQATSVTVNANQEIEVLYAKPMKKQNRSKAPTLQTTDITGMEYQDNCLYQSERMGDDMIVVENDLYG